MCSELGLFLAALYNFIDALKFTLPKHSSLPVIRTLHVSAQTLWETPLPTVLLLLHAYPLCISGPGIINVFTQPLPRSRSYNYVTVQFVKDIMTSQVIRYLFCIFSCSFEAWFNFLKEEGGVALKAKYF
jgi:hypothetical protein